MIKKNSICNSWKNIEVGEEDFCEGLCYMLADDTVTKRSVRLGLSWCENSWALGDRNLGSSLCPQFHIVPVKFLSQRGPLHPFSPKVEMFSVPTNVSRMSWLIFCIASIFPYSDWSFLWALISRVDVYQRSSFCFAWYLTTFNTCLASPPNG